VHKSTICRLLQRHRLLQARSASGPSQSQCRRASGV
jgi:hypothetical protein